MVSGPMVEPFLGMFVRMQREGGSHYYVCLHRVVLEERQDIVAIGFNGIYLLTRRGIFDYFYPIREL